MEDVLLQALHSIALGHAEGNISTDVLIKACNSYKLKTNFDDGYEYQVMVSKSIFDQLNGVEQDEELCKAILPGQTKVIDGILYVYEATKVGSKTQYGWHVSQKNIGAGNKQSASRIATLEKEVNEMFPTDLNSLKVINSNIGGSTGAQLVEDVNGNRYIMKKGTNSNTNNDHVINEYLCNQLYDMVGIKVPNYQLYDEGGTAVLLSRYIPNAQPITSRHYPALAKNFLYDCLFANWDAYKNNDNCLVDSQGKIIHVDNGGTLAFRAHGGPKKFDGDIMDTFTSMQQANPNIASLLDDDDLLSQIAAIRKKKGDLVNYLKEVGEDALAKSIGERIDNLSQIEKAIDRKKNNGGKLAHKKVLPRKLKSVKEMYREFTDAELKEFFDSQKGHGIQRITATNVAGGPGHLMLSEVCKARGFDARGRVVDDAEYQKIIDEAIKKGKHVQLFRGLSPNSKCAYKGLITIENAVSSLLYEDDCFYGSQAAYGQGIYAHINDGNSVSEQSKDKYKSTHAYTHAVNKYAHDGGVGQGAIVKMAMEPDAKIIDFEELREEMKNTLTPGTDKKAIAKCEKELSALEKKMNAAESEVNNYEKNTIAQAYADVHYDEAAWQMYGFTEDGVDWDKKDAYGYRDIPSFHDFVEGHMADLVTANGGTIDKKKGLVVFKLPNSDEEISISEYQYDGPYSIKSVNSAAHSYNYAVARFHQWFEKNQVQYAETVKQDALNNLGDGKQKIVDKFNNLKHDFEQKQRELDKLRTPGKNVNPDDGIYEAIYSASVKGWEHGPVGLYAALKGYDAISVKNGNHSNNSFIVILNRSKLVINKDVDWNV